MADTRTLSEGQTLLLLKEKVLPQHNAAPAPASSPEPAPIPPILIEKRDSEAETMKTEYITGFKLYIVLFGLTLVGFVIMLDQTIVATVS
jgi:hypothetical protein